jgi:FtsP/CotA-like multicopper oxidase with cupredoxin domain
MSGMSGMGGSAMGGITYTINGKAFPDTENLQVNRGDTVILTFVNQGKFVHPMHLHGHAFTPLSMNGQPWASGMLKDTVSVPPSATVVVRFTADNPGVWMIHCHELHHAAGGMDTLLVYQGVPRLANLSGPGQPAPE